nr:RNA-directed DNA polymerase, eukaryota, reverse transcriptase zinc-binding domain protein [Tanacetum cinerariifolium]
DYLLLAIFNWQGEVIIMGDFNEVQKQEERCGSLFNVYGVDAFNLFISYAGLKEVPLGGCSFTWCHKTATKMSKHDRLNWNPMSYAKIKKTVWDYRIDKSPGADGFTFGFFRRYWNLIENNVTEVVFYFFKHGEFPKGGNSSFIALILKNDANMVKDFRLITFIGTFVANRQILDGPFILNELLHWCKKKKQSMIFKVDFEKAYDLVRWDILDDVLRKFGFGSKVGGIMSRIQSWNEIVDKLSTCLSKWKMKNLSIGDRLMLLKLVLVKLSHGNISHSFRRVPSGGLEQFQSQELLDNIEGVSLCESRNRWLWSLEGSGVFTVASVRRYIDERFLPEVSSKTRWINKVPIKVNIHAWKVKLDCLPTKINISR